MEISIPYQRMTTRGWITVRNLRIDAMTKEMLVDPWTLCAEHDTRYTKSITSWNNHIRFGSTETAAFRKQRSRERSRRGKNEFSKVESAKFLSRNANTKSQQFCSCNLGLRLSVQSNSAALGWFDPFVLVQVLAYVLPCTGKSVSRVHSLYNWIYVKSCKINFSILIKNQSLNLKIERSSFNYIHCFYDTFMYTNENNLIIVWIVLIICLVM